MPTEWYMEGPWYKNCNCDPGCPCDFNQDPTQGHCEGMGAMRIDKGHFGDVELSGLSFAAVVRWPGPIHEGNGEILPLIDERASDEQREALLQVMSGQQGDSLFEIFAFVCPTVHEPQFVPFEFEFDLEARKGRVKAGDVLETEVDTLRGIDPPDPYRVLVRIPNGFEYTNEQEEAETALATRLVARGPIEYEFSNSHSSMCYVRHGNAFQTGVQPTVVG
ncbi:MAG: DUF1326 domain-containing protein [Actinobacteria bacterium]|nr:DUF1326 domain-containing protein [Actinomycetota bacterium]